MFFGGRSSRASEAVSYIAANLFLVVVVFYLVLNGVVYDWTGALYTTGFHLNTALDNLIPFVPEWAIFYLYLFYPLSAPDHGVVRRGRLSGGGTPWRSPSSSSTSLRTSVYVVFPVTTDIYRAALLAHPLAGNTFAGAMYAHYGTDPSFNCFPSLHAAVATISFYAWHRYAGLTGSRAARGIAIGMFVIGIGVVLSTLFVKQHYIADEIAGVLLAWGIGQWMFRAWRRPDLQITKS